MNPSSLINLCYHVLFALKNTSEGKTFHVYLVKYKFSENIRAGTCRIQQLLPVNILARRTYDRKVPDFKIYRGVK